MSHNLTHLAVKLGHYVAANPEKSLAAAVAAAPVAAPLAAAALIITWLAKP